MSAHFLCPISPGSSFFAQVSLHHSLRKFLYRSSVCASSPRTPFPAQVLVSLSAQVALRKLLCETCVCQGSPRKASLRKSSPRWCLCTSSLRKFSANASPCELSAQSSVKFSLRVCLRESSTQALSAQFVGAFFLRKLLRTSLRKLPCSYLCASSACKSQTRLLQRRCQGASSLAHALRATFGLERWRFSSWGCGGATHTQLCFGLNSRKFGAKTQPLFTVVSAKEGDMSPGLRVQTAWGRGQVFP